MFDTIASTIIWSSLGYTAGMTIAGVIYGIDQRVSQVALDRFVLLCYIGGFIRGLTGPDFADLMSVI